MPRPHDQTRPAHSFIKPVLLSSLVIGVLVATLLAARGRSGIDGEPGDNCFLRFATQLGRLFGIGSGPSSSPAGGQADRYTEEGGAFALVWAILSGVLRWVRRGFLFLAVLAIFPWIATVVYDLSLWVYRTIWYSIFPDKHSPGPSPPNPGGGTGKKE